LPEAHGTLPIIGRANPVVGAHHDHPVSNAAQNSRKHLERLHLSIVPARYAAHLGFSENPILSGPQPDLSARSVHCPTAAVAAKALLSHVARRQHLGQRHAPATRVPPRDLVRPQHRLRGTGRASAAPGRGQAWPPRGTSFGRFVGPSLWPPCFFTWFVVEASASNRSTVDD